MNKEEFLKRLEQLLSDISEEEKLSTMYKKSFLTMKHIKRKYLINTQKI